MVYWQNTPHALLTQEQQGGFQLSELNEENAKILTTFFTDKKYAKGAKALVDLYQTASNALQGNISDHHGLANKFRNTFNQKNGETPESLGAKLSRKEEVENHPKYYKERIALLRERRDIEAGLVDLVARAIEGDPRTNKQWMRSVQAVGTRVFGGVSPEMRTNFVENVTGRRFVDIRYRNLGVVGI